MHFLIRYILSCTFIFLYCGMVSGQFIDEFDCCLARESKSPRGWSIATGDGMAKINFQQHEGYASVYVDATQDNRNIWWALIRRPVPGIF